MPGLRLFTDALPAFCLLAACAQLPLTTRPEEGAQPFARCSFAKPCPTSLGALARAGLSLPWLTGEAVAPAARIQQSEAVIVARQPEGESESRLFIEDPGQGCSQRMTQGPGSDSEPVFSRDGRYVAFKRSPGSQIFVAYFSYSNAPCDGSRIGFEFNLYELKR